MISNWLCFPFLPGLWWCKRDILLIIKQNQQSGNLLLGLIKTNHWTDLILLILSHFIHSLFEHLTFDYIITVYSHYKVFQNYKLNRSFLEEILITKLLQEYLVIRKCMMLKRTISIHYNVLTGNQLYKWWQKLEILFLHLNSNTVLTLESPRWCSCPLCPRVFVYRLKKTLNEQQERQDWHPANSPEF